MHFHKPTTKLVIKSNLILNCDLGCTIKEAQSFVDPRMDTVPNATYTSGKLLVSLERACTSLKEPEVP